jgi:hypothetical protein
VAAQSGAKEQYYCTIYYITLNSTWKLGEHLKISNKIVEDRVIKA